jgi:polysaccharide deacetylase 2 family uncharacterized protein YibQ
VAKKPAPPKQRTEQQRRGPLLLVLAWTLLIAGVAGLAVWHNYFAEEAEAPPAEPFFIALEPDPQSEIAAPTDEAAALPPMPDSTDVQEMGATPPGTTPAPGVPASPAPARTAQPRAPAPAGGAPAGDQQVAAVAPRVAPPSPPAAWQEFARPFDPDDARPRIAVVIVDLGLSNAATAAAIQNLPGAVTLSFSPYAESLESWINLARAAGHEALLGLPMEPANFPVRDPGPRTLLTSLSPRQNIERMDWVLSRVSGYVGVTNNMGSRFTASTDALRPVLTSLRDRGLVFLDARTSPRSVAAGLATSLGLPRAINDRLIDQEAARASIDANLADIERVARETGNAVAMGQPFPVTFERLNNWLQTLEAKGFALAPVTAMLNRQPDS